MWFASNDTALLLFFISGNDLLNQGVTHDIGLGKGAESDAFQGLKKLPGLKEP